MAAPHLQNFIEFVDLENNGMVTECAIMKRFENGDIYYFTLNSLDIFDKRRLRDILYSQTATMYTELWKLLEQNTLGNGVNALSYFNQLVKHRTHNGQILPFGSGKYSMPVQPQPMVREQAPVQPNQPEAQPAFDNMVKNNKANAPK